MSGLRNIQLTPQLVQAVRDAADIVDIASEHTRLRKAGRRSSGLCPLHKEKTPSFSVDPERGLFYCFGCGQGGDAIRLHMLVTGDDFPAAIEALARRYGIPLPARRAPRPGERTEPDLEPVLEAAAEFFTDQLKRSAPTRRYLEERRIPPELVERYGLGYAPEEWRELVGALKGRFRTEELEAAGLVARSPKRPDEPYDRFRHRLMFPIHSPAGRLVGFGGRTLGDDQAKYINTAETARFHKSRLLYGLHLAKRAMRESGQAVLVEGYFDVLGAVASGLPATVASMGTSLTADQARLLRRFADEVVIGYDGDEAGTTAARRALPLLLGESLAVRRARFGAGHDPDSLRLAEGEERVAAAVAEAPDLVTAELERLIPRGESGPQQQARAARAVTELLQPVADPILRYGYARIAAERLGVPIDLFWRRLGGGERGRPQPEAEAGRAAAPEVRSVEERVIHMLLDGVEPAVASELPPEEVFFDATNRNIYRVYSALYREREGAPTPEAILAELGSEGRAVDHVARILLEGRFASGPREFQDSLRHLERRWQRQRLRVLSTEIHGAQRDGDAERLGRLLEEKTALSRRLHGRSDETESGSGEV